MLPKSTQTPSKDQRSPNALPSRTSTILSPVTVGWFGVMWWWFLAAVFIDFLPDVWWYEASIVLYVTMPISSALILLWAILRWRRSRHPGQLIHASIVTLLMLFMGWWSFGNCCRLYWESVRKMRAMNVERRSDPPTATEPNCGRPLPPDIEQ